MSNTPTWVFVVFVALLFLGYQQSKDRTVGRVRLLILPLAMLAFSLYGVSSSFGFEPLPLFAWLLGFLPLVALARSVLKPHGVSYSPASASFHIRGSWLPMALLMSIFWVKYAVGYTTARNLPLAHELWFTGCVSLLLGLLGGAFTARAVSIWCVSSSREGYA
jgi:hypothetical protein